MKIKIGVLFCGPGGIALGAHNAAENVFSHAWAIDYHQDTCNTFLHNIHGADASTVICQDVKDLDVNKLKKIQVLMVLHTVSLAMTLAPLVQS